MMEISMKSLTSNFCRNRTRNTLIPIPSILGLLLCFVLGFPTLRAETPANRAPGEPLKVLFIGNSLTSSNDLPGTLAALAKAGGKPFIHDSSILPGRPLKEHWEDKKQRSLKMIQSQKWDIVVLQDYSSQPVTAPEDMVTYGTLFSKEIAKQGAKTAWFMTWAGRNHPKDQPIFTKAYGDLATATGGILVPVGIAWESFTGDDRQALFPGSDQKHPSPAGTYLSACVFYGVFFHASPVGLPVEQDVVMPNGKPSGAKFDAAQARRYQEAAWTAVQGVGKVSAKAATK
jgi:hypothetical protein